MSSVLKASYFAVDNNEKVIDSNETVAKRIQLLQEIMQKAATAPTEDDFNPNFVEGLDAASVEMLLADDGDGYSEYDESYDNQGVYDDGYNNQISSEQLDQMIENANSEAQRIIDEANRQAEEILNAARMDAQQIMSDAKEEGFQAGYDDGYAKAYEELEAKSHEVDVLKEEIEHDYEQKLDELEPMFIDTLTSVYSHVLGVSLEDDTKVLLHLCEEAIHNIEGSNSFFVHVSKDCYEEVVKAKDELTRGLGSNAVVEIIEDVTLKGTEGFIEADSGIFDISLGTELENLKKELVMLSYHKDN